MKTETKCVKMKAVAKFKGLLEKKKPSADVHRPHASGRPSPQSTISQSSSASAQSGSTPGPFLAADANYLDVAASSSSSVRSGTSSGQGTVTPRTIATSSRNSSERSNSGDLKQKHLHRILTASSDRSHAHDPSLDEPLYLGIGAGKNDQMEKSDLLEVPDEDGIAESPQAADFSIYDVAYEKEVERIRLAHGHDATVYSNKRVEGDNELPSADQKSRGRVGWAQILNRMQEKENEKPEKSNQDTISGPSRS